MKESNLKPFLRENLDILFVGLNPAKGSSDNGHYFSVRQSFWRQLYESGLILKEFPKEIADDYIFGTNIFNYRQKNFGITDLIPEIAESDSKKIKILDSYVPRLLDTITNYEPKIVIFFK